MILVVIVCELSAFLCHDHCEALLCLLTMFGMCVAVLIQQICFIMFHNTAHYKRLTAGYQFVAVMCVLY